MIVGERDNEQFPLVETVVAPLDPRVRGDIR
jgi:hypothetical protein